MDVARSAQNRSEENQQPSAERRAPNAERRTPNAERRTPNAERQAPSAKRQAPSAKRQAPKLRFRSFLCRIPLLCCFLFGHLAGLGCAQREETPNGLVVLGSSEHDFGSHHQEEVLTHEFSLMNKFATPVQIVEVKTSCGCLVAGKIDSHIPPGGKVVLPVRFNTGAAQETASGSIAVGYRKVDDAEDAAQPEYVALRVRAGIIPYYRIEPREIDFGVVNGMAVQRATRVIRIVPAAAPAVKVLKAHSSSKYLQTRVLQKETRDPATSVEVSLDVSGFTRNRWFNGYVVISTDSKRIAKALVPVRAEYHAPAQIEPSANVIGSEERGEVKRDLRVKTSCPARILGTRSSSANGARIEFDSGPTAKEHVLYLFVAPCREKSFDGEFQVDVQLFPDGGEITFRTLRVQVYRFTQKGIGNE